jgi:Flp pilus assembly protein CpaB
MGRLRGCVWLTAGLVVALLAGFIGFTALQRATVQRAEQPQGAPEVQVVVAVHAIPVRAQLKAEDLAIRNLPVDAAPEGALRGLDEATGKVSLVELFTGEVVLQTRLVDPNVQSGDGRLALALAPDQVLMAFPEADLMLKSGTLKPGDHVDLLFSNKFKQLNGGGNATGGSQEFLVTFSGLQNVIITAMVVQGATEGQGGVVQGVMLAVSEQDALVLKNLKDAGAILDVVLRAPGVEQPFTTEPVDGDYLIRRYRITNASGR